MARSTQKNRCTEVVRSDQPGHTGRSPVANRCPGLDLAGCSCGGHASGPGRAPGTVLGGVSEAKELPTRGHGTESARVQHNRLLRVWSRHHVCSSSAQPFAEDVASVRQLHRTRRAPEQAAQDLLVPRTRLVVPPLLPACTPSKICGTVSGAHRTLIDFDFGQDTPVLLVSLGVRLCCCLCRIVWPLNMCVRAAYKCFLCP